VFRQIEGEVQCGGAIRACLYCNTFHVSSCLTFHLRRWQAFI